MEAHEVTKTFTHFPEGSICPICETGDDSETVLVPIAGTGDGKICEAQPFHTSCIRKIPELTWSREENIIWARLGGGL